MLDFTVYSVGSVQSAFRLLNVYRIPQDLGEHFIPMILCLPPADAERRVVYVSSSLLNGQSEGIQRAEAIHPSSHDFYVVTP